MFSALFHSSRQIHCFDFLDNVNLTIYHCIVALFPLNLHLTVNRLVKLLRLFGSFILLIVPIDKATLQLVNRVLEFIEARWNYIAQ